MIGERSLPDGTTDHCRCPKLSFGFASGGTDFDGKNAANRELFRRRFRRRVDIQPVAFLVVKDGCVRTIQLLSNAANSVDRALTMLPELVDRIRSGNGRKRRSYPQEGQGCSAAAGADAPGSTDELICTPGSLHQGFERREAHKGERFYGEKNVFAKNNERAGAVLRRAAERIDCRRAGQGQWPPGKSGGQDGPQPGYPARGR